MLDDDVVTVRLDGSPILAGFSFDAEEHSRRVALGAGGVTCSRLLHGLWLLPAGMPVAEADLPDVKVSRLRQAVEHVAETQDGFERLYSPAGAVRSLTFIASNVERGIRRAIRHPPIFERTVLVKGSVTEQQISLARGSGVGLTVVNHRGDLTVELPPPPREVGVPAVYRWWVAEVAYEAALNQRRAQLSS